MDNVPILFDGKAIVISLKEKDFLDAFLVCGDIDEASLQSGLDRTRAHEFINSDRVKSYVVTKVEAIARKNNITLDTVLERLHKIAFEGLKASKAELRALEMLASYIGVLKPATTNIAVGIKMDNPLERKTDDELEHMIKSRLDGPRATPQITQQEG